MIVVHGNTQSVSFLRASLCFLGKFTFVVRSICYNVLYIIEWDHKFILFWKYVSI